MTDGRKLRQKREMRLPNQHIEERKGNQTDPEQENTNEQQTRVVAN